MQARLAK